MLGDRSFFVNGDIFRDCNDIKTKMFNQAEPMSSPYNTTIVFTKTRNKESGCIECLVMVETRNEM